MQALEFSEIVCFTLYNKKFHKNLCFPLLLALHTFGYFVQFSRCGSGLLKPDSSTQLLPNT